MKRAIHAALLAAALAMPAPASAQGRILPGAVGALSGMGAGGYVSVGVVALRARRGHYLFALKDAFGWDSAAVIAGGGTGIVLGIWDPNRLQNTILSTAALGLVGTGIGAAIGHVRWPPPEGKWAGAVIGGGVGVLAGAVVGVLLPSDLLGSEQSETGIPFLLQVPFE